jgi:hypothetical protein
LPSRVLITTLRAPSLIESTLRLLAFFSSRTLDP